eukprot:m.46381 g.46381  ORF g.46381 m.46381 type:complete len:270 (-) comp17518_c0_seq1:31-840(-)
MIVEYRIPMPFSVEEYRIGQLYMIAKHSSENTSGNEGIEVIVNEPCEDEVHGKGQFTEKRIHLGSSLPSWIKAVIPKIFYITEKAWNFFPYCITEYKCSFFSRFSVRVITHYVEDRGENDLIFEKDELPDTPKRTIDMLDIAADQIPEKHKKECPDLQKFVSEKTGRGPLTEGWQKSMSPMMTSYKVIDASFEVWGLQSRVEKFMHKAVRDVLLVGHLQAFAWIDEWHGMTMEDIREYEKKAAEVQNSKIKRAKPPVSPSSPRPDPAPE